MAADKHLLESQVREVLGAVADAIALSGRLFSPNGLFRQMAKPKAERRQVTASPLFKEAQRRLSDLQRQEADERARQVQGSPHLAGTPCVMKLERS